MAQMTAVDWLVRKLSNELIGEIPLHRWDEIRETVQQAKQMDKEQSKRDYYAGLEGYIVKDGGFEQYYNETYGNNQK